MREISSIPNAARTFDALRSLGYDINSSLADIVDNSLADRVGARKIDIYLGHSSEKRIFCKVKDDGCGMTDDELKEAMRIGADSSYDQNDLGKFGMGMKTASLSHCNSLTVLSRKKGANWCGYCWDISRVRQNGWVLLQLNNRELDAILKQFSINAHSYGTIVLWQEMILLEGEFNSYQSNRHAENFLFRVIEDLRLHLGMVFHRFLEGMVEARNSVVITVNGENCEPWNPFCINEPNTNKIDLSKTIAVFAIPGYSTPVRLNAYVLPNKERFTSDENWKRGRGLLSWNDAQGYYIYRADRIIRFGGWHGTKAKDEHDKLARIAIDIDPSLDSLFRITVNKAKIQFPELLYHHLKSHVNPIVVKKAKAAYNKSGESLQVNNNFRKNNSTVQNVSKQLLNNNNITTQASADTKSIQVQNPTGLWLANKVSDFLKYGGDKDFEIVSGKLNDGRLWTVLCHEGDKFKVVVNASHPFYAKIYKSGLSKSVTDSFDALLFSLAFAELYNRNNQNSLLFDTFNEIASKTLGKLIKEKVL